MHTGYAYRICIQDMHTGYAYRICIQDMHTGYAYRICILCLDEVPVTLCWIKYEQLQSTQQLQKELQKTRFISDTHGSGVKDPYKTRVQ